MNDSLIIEVNAHGENPEAYDKVHAIGEVFNDITDAVRVLETAQEFALNPDIQQVVPTLCEKIEEVYNETLVMSEVSSIINPPAPKQELSPEALEYLRTNAQAAGIHGINQEILEEDYSLKKTALSPEDAEIMREGIEKLDALVHEAISIYESIMGFGEDDCDFDEEEYDSEYDEEEYEDEEYDPSSYTPESYDDEWLDENHEGWEEEAKRDMENRGLTWFS